MLPPTMLAKTRGRTRASYLLGGKGFDPDACAALYRPSGVDAQTPQANAGALYLWYLAKRASTPPLQHAC
jgi:hypothetical protein